jgi:hypothetical protein
MIVCFVEVLFFGIQASTRGNSLVCFALLLHLGAILAKPFSLFKPEIVALA